MRRFAGNEFFGSLEPFLPWIYGAGMGLAFLSLLYLPGTPALWLLGSGLVFFLLDIAFGQPMRTGGKSWVSVYLTGAAALFLIYLADPARAEGSGWLDRLRLLGGSLAFLLGLFSVLLRFLIAGKGEASAGGIMDRDRYTGSLQIVLQILIAIVLFLLANIAGALMNPSFDLSPGYYSLSEPSRALIQSLKRPVTLYAFLPVQQAVGDEREYRTLPELYRISEDIRMFLEQVALASPDIRVEFKNAEIEADARGEFGNVSNGLILIRSLNKNPDMDQAAYSERKLYVKKESDLADLESNLVRALIQVSGKEKKVCLPFRNGERTPAMVYTDSGADLKIIWKELGYYNFVFDSISEDSGWPERIPDSCDVIFLSGPLKRYDAFARQTLLDYYHGGGKLFAAYSYGSEEDFDWLLEGIGSSYRIRKGRMTVVSTYPGLIITDHGTEHPIVGKQKMDQRPFFVFPAAARFEKIEENSSNRQRSEPEKKEVSGGKAKIPPTEESIVLFTVPRTFLDGNLNGRKDPGETRVLAPLVLAGSSVRDASPGRILLFSGVDWLSDRAMKFPMMHSNRFLAAESLLWLTESNVVARIGRETRKSRRIQVSEELKARNLTYGVVLFPSGIALASFIFLIFLRYRRIRDRKARNEDP